MIEKIPVRRLRFARVVSGCLLLACFAGSGCSIHRYALNQASDAVAQSGATYASDDDPELVKAAAPFGLKLTESLLAENPRHLGLLTSAASGFTQYSYAFVQEEADEVEPHDFAAAEAMRGRARHLYLRAQGYGLRGLEVKHPGFGKALLANPKATVRTATKPDVPLLYWTAAAWASAISLSKDHPELVGQIPAMEALIDRALELDILHREVASQKEIFENRYKVLDCNIKNFHHISSKLQMSLNLEEILKLCAEGLHGVLGYERVNILMS